MDMLKAGYVSIIGRPNAGKSTLMNNILGSELSIVTPKAQTTRERVFGILTEKQGQMVFIDTPGIHRAKDGGINSFMVREAAVALKEPHLIWYLVDPFSTVPHETPVIELLEKTRAPVLLLMNKLDLFKKIEPSKMEGFEATLIEIFKEKNIQFAGCKHISGRSKKGLPDLIEESWKHLPEGEPYYADPEQLSDKPTRFFVSEKIREQLFHCLGDEIPYSCAVEIEKFEEDKKPIRIEAMIMVERESQKGIVIGKNAAKIKEIGQEARGQIEKFLGEKIFLGLRVKVLKDWSKDAELLKRFGYTPPKKASK